VSWRASLVTILAAASLSPALAQDAASGKPLVLVVPHTHWEGAVFKTREEYLQIGLPHILKALTLLKVYPNYHFVLDQMCYVKPFLDRYPAEVPAFRKFLSEGRLQIAGGTDSMHDNNMPSGESIVRQYLLSKRFFRERLGYDVTTGWGLDTFGHNGQMPQILKLAGMKSYWFQRGPSIDAPAEFLWQGIDGTQVPAFWLAATYGQLHDVPTDPVEFDRLVRARFDQLAPFTKGRERVFTAGADVWEPEEALPRMIEQFNRAVSSPFVLQLAVPADYEALIARRTDRPVIKGELNPVFQGIYSTRIEVKQTMRDLERILTSAEKASVLAGESTRGEIERAWDPVLFNQAHDLASGVMVDKVCEDSMAGYSFSRRLGEEILRTRLDSVAARIDTQGTGVPVAVFNLLGWPRTDVAEADVGFIETGIRDLTMTGPDGQPVPMQIVSSERNGDGGIRQAHIIFVARDVPAMGYALYRIAPGAGTGAAMPGARNSTSMYEDRGTIENEYYRASFNLWTGEMTSLVVKDGEWEALSAPANVVAREPDGGDFWELYGTLNGGRLTAMTKETPSPKAGRAEFSNQNVGGSGRTRNGPVFSEFHITHPFGANQFSTTVRLYRGVRRVDIRSEIFNNDQFVRYRVLFPTSIANGTSTHEIAFGAIERPAKREFPAQNWVDYGDGARGVSLLNRGLPGNNVADGTLMLSLMRSTRLISYGYIGGFEPGVGSDTALELGKRLNFDYALMPHAGDWQRAGTARAGLEFNNPLIAQAVAPHAGTLPARWGLLEVSDGSAVVTALKPGPDGASILRVYESSGRPATGVRVKLRGNVSAVHEANLIEDAGAAIAVRDGAFQFDLHPYEIKTFKLELKPNP
jgi:alpha-mannosidase